MAVEFDPQIREKAYIDDETCAGKVMDKQLQLMKKVLIITKWTGNRDDENITDGPSAFLYSWPNCTNARGNVNMSSM